ncbi:hypothetical protein [Streptomyces cellulosae]|uniref:hypothetical protein n=1 Tax=Streptomyces cellulosae TaxID=1968 RepID=UPI000AB5BBE5|nr:hypothetical protein [Streptomyces cellulosae]
MLASWRHGTVVRSWLLDLLARALDQDPGPATLAGRVDDSGEGRWAVEEAVRRSVSAPAMSAARARRRPGTGARAQVWSWPGRADRRSAAADDRSLTSTPYARPYRGAAANPCTAPRS